MTRVCPVSVSPFTTTVVGRPGATAGGKVGVGEPPSSAGWTAGAALIVLLVLIVWLGVYPSPLIDWIRLAASATLP